MWEKTAIQKEETGDYDPWDTVIPWFPLKSFCKKEMILQNHVSIKNINALIVNYFSGYSMILC